MNEFNVLLGAATNGTPSGSLFDALFARYIAPQESWRELESPLPITILSAGEDLIDYRIYGNTVQTGTPTPENPIMPIGCGERTENLLDVSQIKKVGTYQSGNCTFECDENTTYTFSSSKTMQAFYAYGDSNYSSDRIKIAYNIKSVSFNTGARSTVYIRFDLAKTSDDYRTADLMFVEGSTAPTSYIPYGYQLPMVVTNGTTTTTTPIYIGDTQLMQDEYVSYSEQKIYKKVNGTLTPQDPPTPIPALPTTKGATTFEYDGGEPQPDQMYVKYRRKD